MRRVNLSMVMLFCFACAALLYLILTQLTLSSASPIRLQDDPTNTATATATATQSGSSYFITATLPGASAQQSAFATEPASEEEPLVYVTGAGGMVFQQDEPTSESGGRRMATPTRTPTPINVGNFVWDDIDKDGRQDVGEPGIAGVTVQLWNRDKNQLIDQTQTNANGNYTLVAPTPGDYRVRVLLPNPAIDTFSPKDNVALDDLLDSDINPSGSDPGFTDIYTFGANLISITSIDAGIIIYRVPTPTRTPTPINVGNFVWDDLNENGRQDVGEPGIAGVTVQLWNGNKNQLIDQTQTNANGNYTLVAPTPGDYRVRVIKPSTYDTFTILNAPGADQDLLDSDIILDEVDAGFTAVYTFGSNLISITSIDAGIITADPITLGDRVWYDTDGNGVQNTEEPGIAGRMVRLRRHAPPVDVTVYTTTTDANGNYQVIAPIAGTYYICVTVNNGEVISPMNAIDEGFLPDLRDSDIYPTAMENGRGCTADFTVSNDTLTVLANSYDAGISTAHASVVGQLTWQGRPAAPHANYIVPVRLRIVPSGGGAPVFDSYVTTNNMGNFTAGAVTPGTYVVWVKHDRSLARRLVIPLVAGNNLLNFGTLYAGDANNDNEIGLIDFSILASNYGKLSGEPAYDARADLNNDGAVNLTDFSLLAGNYSQVGAVMP